MASTNNNVISKPQVVATALKSRADIQQYTTAAGDTISSLAAKFGVTSDSIRWSNNLAAAGDSISPGTHLAIPPVNGMVYTVKPGDTLSGIAAALGLPGWQGLYEANLAVIGGDPNLIRPGQVLVIPST